MGNNFDVVINICGMKTSESIFNWSRCAWDRWLMVSRAFGLKRKVDSILIFFFPGKGKHDSVSPLAVMDTAATGGQLDPHKWNHKAKCWY